MHACICENKSNQQQAIKPLLHCAATLLLQSMMYVNRHLLQ
jgi:hypothetical protein